MEAGSLANGPGSHGAPIFAGAVLRVSRTRRTSSIAADALAFEPAQAEAAKDGAHA